MSSITDMILDAARRGASAEPPPADAGRVVPFPAPPPGAPAAAEDDDKVLSFEKLSLLPQARDPYLAHARPVNQFLPMLVLIAKDGMKTVFSYGDLRMIEELPPKRPGNGPGLLLRFLGVREAELEGGNLDNLLGYLYLHRIAWIRERPPGRLVRDDNAIVITSMTIREIEP